MLNVAPQEVTKVASLAVLEQEEVPILLESIYDYRAVSFEGVNLNDVWVALQKL